MNAETQPPEKKAQRIKLVDLLQSGSLASAVWTSAVTHRDAAPESLRDSFNANVLHYMRHARLPMGGARDGSEVKIGLLRRNARDFINAVRTGSRVGFSSSALWAHSNTELHAAAMRFAAAKGLGVRSAEVLADGTGRHLPRRWPAPWEQKQLDDLAAEFASLSGASTDEARLMLFMVCVEDAPAPENRAREEAVSPVSGATLATPAAASPEPLTSALLTSFLGSVEALGDEAPEWAQLPSLLGALGVLVAQRDERRAQGISRLAAALHRLQEPSVQKGLNRLPKLQGHETWAAVAFVPATANTVAEQLEALVPLIEELEGLFDQPSPAALTVDDIALTQQRFQRILELTTEVKSRYERVAAHVRVQPPLTTEGPGVPNRTRPIEALGQAIPQAATAVVTETSPDAAQPSVVEVAPEATKPSEERPAVTPALVVLAEDTTTIAAAVHSSAGEELSSMPLAEPIPDVSRVVPAPLQEGVASLPPPRLEQAPDSNLSQASPPPQDNVAPVPILSAGSVSRRMAAEALLRESSRPTQAAFLYALVSDGDVAGAYWLARALEADGVQAAIPSWLLAALTASAKLSADGSLLAAGLHDIVSKAPSLSSEQRLQELALAAALPSVLRTPASGLMNWLVVPHGAPYLSALVEAVRSFAAHGQVIPDNLQEVLGTEAERGERLAGASAEAARWLEHAQAKRTGHGPANKVWRELTRNDKFGELLRMAASDDRSELRSTREALDQFAAPNAVDLLIDERSRSHSRDGKLIEDPALTWLRNLVEEGLARVQDWLHIAELDEKMRGSGNWLRMRLREFQERLASALSTALDGLNNHAHDDTAATAAAHAALRRAFYALDTMLRCNCGIPAVESPPDVQFCNRLLEGGGNLHSLLARRLLTVPSLRLPSGPERWGAELEPLVRELPKQTITPPSVTHCLDNWMGQEDFRFTSLLLDVVDDTVLQQQLSERIAVGLDAARRKLKGAVQQAREEIERAYVDGVIDERSRLTGRLEGLYTEGLRDLQFPQRVLNEVNRELIGARDDKVAMQRERWTTLKERLASANFDAHGTYRANGRVEELLADSDYRNADVLLAELTNYLDNQRPPDPTLFTPDEDRQRHFENFLRVLPRLEQELKSISGRDTPKRAQEVFAQELEHAESRRDVKGLYEQWLKVVPTRANKEESLRSVAMVLSALGFKPNTERVSRVVQHDGRVTVFEFAVSSLGASPVPHFGSRVDYRLRVHCAGVPVVTRPMHAVDPFPPAEGEGALVFYFGRLGLDDRRRLSDACRNANHAVIVIDEWLLLYLAGLPEGDRLQAMFACALPFSAINPYSERASASVPQEMFFGREDMARELLSFTGTCLVYGGRQLGKSALLEQVERRFKALGGPGPSVGRVGHRTHNAIRLNIKNIGDLASEKPPEALWSLLADELKRVGFLPKTPLEKPDKLINAISDYLSGERPSRLLILLDEADNFLDADAKKNFQQVKRLSDLMTRNPDRCKVVLAGLHNVQRFQGIPNQPLAHFGRALLVGPLEPRHADELVRRPLEALGFRFPKEEKNASVLRILSYTNYHPGLIQLFCRDLVSTLQRRGGPHHSPPYTIRVADVEEAYRKEDTRRLIRERFEWTLALDPRYQAIAWSLIVHNHNDDAPDGYARAFYVGDILTQVATFWPQGFEGVDQEQMRALLDEMEGLGVLARDSRGAYRLRSPNVVRLLGHVDNIWERLGELEKKTFTGAFHADYHHVKLDDDRPPRVSPLTYAQGRSLCESNSHTALILGARATHLDDLPIALARLEAGRDSNSPLTCVPIPKEALAPKHLRDWILAHANDSKATGALLYWTELTPESARDGVLVDAAVKLCTEPRWTNKRWLRIVFAMRPAAAWEWAAVACAAQSSRLDVRTLSLKRWTLPALDRLLDGLDIPSDEPFQTRLLKTITGGWPILIRAYATQALQHLSKRAQHQDGRRAADEFDRALTHGTAEAMDFWRALELDALPRVVDVLRVIHDIGGVSFGTDLAGFLEGDTSTLVGRSDDLLRLLQSFGCLELQDTKLVVEPRVAKVLPA